MQCIHVLSDGISRSILQICMSGAHLSDVVETVEDVLPGLLALDAGLQLVLLGRLQAPERIRTVHISVKELRRFACTAMRIQNCIWVFRNKNEKLILSSGVSIVEIRL